VRGIGCFSFESGTLSPQPSPQRGEGEGRRVARTRFYSFFSPLRGERSDCQRVRPEVAGPMTGSGSGLGGSDVSVFEFGTPSPRPSPQRGEGARKDASRELVTMPVGRPNPFIIPSVDAAGPS
jgi:hypothetical protein